MAYTHINMQNKIKGKEEKEKILWRSGGMRDRGKNGEE